MIRTILLVLVVACGKESAAPPTADKVVDPKPTASVDAAPAGPDVSEVMAWLPKTAKDVWQGAWLTKLALRDGKGWSSFTGTYVAMEVAGDKVKVWDAATQHDHELFLTFKKPCVVTFEKRTKDSTEYFDRNFSLDGQTIYVGTGGTGYRKGKAAVVCKDDKVYVLDGKGACRVWTERFGKWEVADGKCKFVDKPAYFAAFHKGLGNDAFVIDEGGVGNELASKGDVLADQSFMDTIEKTTDHVKQTDFEAAKAAATKRFKETDPLERAKTAGGKVGDTSTIVSLHATFLDDRKAIKDKALSFTGKLGGVDKTELKGKPVWKVVVFDAADKDKSWELVCVSNTEVKAREAGDRVKVSGTVGEWWDRPALYDCKVAR